MRERKASHLMDSILNRNRFKPFCNLWQLQPIRFRRPDSRVSTLLHPDPSLVPPKKDIYAPPRFFLLVDKLQTEWAIEIGVFLIAFNFKSEAEKKNQKLSQKSTDEHQRWKITKTTAFWREICIRTSVSSPCVYGLYQKPHTAQNVYTKQRLSLSRSLIVMIQKTHFYRKQKVCRNLWSKQQMFDINDYILSFSLYLTIILPKWSASLLDTH